MNENDKSPYRIIQLNLPRVDAVNLRVKAVRLQVPLSRLAWWLLKAWLNGDVRAKAIIDEKLQEDER